MSSREAVLQADNLWKRYGKVQAVSGISFTCYRGEFLVILGPSGAGKTTTLKLISGLEEADQGSIRLEGRPIDHLEPKDRNVAMVFETYALYPHLTVFENMASPLRAAKMAQPAVQERVEQVARMLGMEALLDRLPAQLSGGQRQRVSLGRALAKAAAIYLMDEPIAHLDAKLRHEVRGEFKRLQHELHLTMLYVTHDYREALALADRVLVLNQGKVEQVGPPDELFRAPANTTVARLLGDPPMNLIDGQMQTHEGRAIFTNSHLAIPLPPALASHLGTLAAGHRLVAGVRPGDIALVPREQGVAAGECYTFEPLGTDAIVTVKIGELLLKVRTPKEQRLAIGDPVWLRFNPSGLHFFDTAGRRVAGGADAA